MGVLLEKGTEIPYGILNSFSETAAVVSNSLGVSPIESPSDVLDTGLNIARKLGDPGMSISRAVAMAVSGILVTLSFTVVSILLSLAWIESFIVAALGLIFISFGALRVSRSYGLNYFKVIIASGIRLYVMMIIIALGFSIVVGWENAEYNTFESYLALAGATVMFAGIVLGMDRMAASLAAGSFGGVGGSPLIAMMNGARGGASAAAGASIGAGVGTYATASALNRARKGARAEGKGHMKSVAIGAGRVAKNAIRETGRFCFRN